jgi:hypothetical protein
MALFCRLTPSCSVWQNESSMSGTEGQFCAARAVSVRGRRTELQLLTLGTLAVGKFPAQVSPNHTTTGNSTEAANWGTPVIAGLVKKCWEPAEETDAPTMNAAKIAKTYVFKACLGIGISSMAALTAQAQFGYVQFQNFSPPNPIYDGRFMQPAAGSNYKVTLYYGASPANLSAASGSTTTLLSGGSFSGCYSSGMVQLPPFLEGAVVYVQARAWYPATYPSYEAAVSSGDVAVVAGVSSVVSKTIGSPLSPVKMLELGGFYLQPVVSPLGALQVTLSPSSVVSSGGQWCVDGGSWQSSGTTVSGLSAGSHTVSFSSVSGWTTPANLNVSVSGGALTTATGTYVAQTGNLQVTINPAAAVSAGAQWQVDGGAWRNSGTTASGLSVGSHILNFSTVSGWTTPTYQSVTVSNNQTTAATGTYVPQTGALQVAISPAAAVSAGAQWRVDGGSWQSSGAVLSGLSLGSHVVSFSSVSGWIVPTNQTAMVSMGATTMLNGVYQVYVVITPDAGSGGGTNGFGPNGFSLNLTGTPGQTFVMEGSTNLVNWVPLQTNILTDGSSYFSDPQCTNYPGRYYRLRSP